MQFDSYAPFHFVFYFASFDPFEFYIYVSCFTFVRSNADMNTSISNIYLECVISTFTFIFFKYILFVVLCMFLCFNSSHSFARAIRLCVSWKNPLLFFLVVCLLVVPFTLFIQKNTCLSSDTLLYKLFQSAIRYNNKYQWNKSKMQAHTHARTHVHTHTHTRAHTKAINTATTMLHV